MGKKSRHNDRIPDAVGRRNGSDFCRRIQEHHERGNHRAQYHPTHSQKADGYYLIGSAAELYGFAEFVNNGNANAKFTAGITINENVLEANRDVNTSDFIQRTPTEI